MEKTYKVMFLLHDSMLNGGATRSMLDVILKLKKENLIEPIIVYPDKDETMLKLLKEHEIKYYRIKYSTWFYNKQQNIYKKCVFFIKAIIKHWISYFNSFKIYNIIKKNNVELIYTNTKTIYLGCFLKRKYKIPHIWHIREFGKEDHNIEPIFGDNNFSKLLNRYTDKIIVISEALKEKYVSDLNDKEKINVLYDDIDKSFINPKEKFLIEDRLKIAIIGSISKEKGQLEGIKAIERIKNTNVKLYIAGRKNDYSKYLENYVKINNLTEMVEFVGFVKNINDFRKNMDIVLVTSQKEAFGRTTIEGMLSQLLVIASNTGCNIELIQDGKNGFLYELHNDKMLAEIIFNMYKDRNKLKEVALNGYETAQKFTKGKTAIEIYQIIKEIIDKKNNNDR